MKLFKIITFFYIQLLFFQIGLSFDNPQFSVNVSRSNVLYDTEVKARTVFLGKNVKIGDYQVKTDDSLKRVYEKLIVMQRLLIRNFSKKNVEIFGDNCQLSNQLYPGSTAISVMYAISEFYSSSDQIPNAIILLVPFTQEFTSSPAIPRLLCSFTNHYINNFNPVSDKFIYKALDSKDNSEVKKRLMLLRDYWATKIDPQYSTRWSKQAVEAAKSKMKNGGNMQALEIWQRFVNFLYIKKKDDDKHIEEQQKRDSELRKVISRVETLKKEREKGFKASLSNLDCLLDSPNSLSKIEMCFNKISKYRKELKNYSDIPIYNELKKIYKGTDEADVINIAFKAYIQRKYKQCLDMIKRIPGKTDDTRLMSVQIYCMQKLKRPSPEIIAVIDKVIKLEPKNFRAFMLKRMLEAKDDFKNTHK